MRSLAAAVLMLLIIIACKSAIGAGGGVKIDDLLRSADSLIAPCQTADKLSSEQIEKLAIRCDSLILFLEKIDFSKKRLLIFRLKKCLRYFHFILEARKKEVRMRD